MNPELGMPHVVASSLSVGIHPKTLNPKLILSSVSSFDHLGILTTGGIRAILGYGQLTSIHSSSYAHSAAVARRSPRRVSLALGLKFREKGLGRRV